MGAVEGVFGHGWEAAVRGSPASQWRNFVQEVDRFTATESLVHESIDKQWQPVSAAKCEFNYVVSIQEVLPE